MRRLLCCLLLCLCATAAAAPVRYQADPMNVTFTHAEQAFSSFGYDTGWQPSSGPVQVRFLVDVGGGFDATAPGVIRLGWKPDLWMWPEGEPLGGTLNMDVGVQVKALLKLDLSIPGGPHYTWQGNIPGVPNFDYRFADQKPFTPFLLQGASPASVTVSDVIQKTRLYRVPLTQSIIPIPGIGGFLDVDVGGTLKAVMSGLRVAFAEGDVTTQPGEVAWVVPEQPSLISSARYESTVSHRGTVNLEPAVVVTVGPLSWTLAQLNLPVPLPSQTSTWVFNETQTSFLLPRLRIANLGGRAPEVGSDRTVTVDMGDEEVGQLTSRTLTLENNGLAPIAGELYPSGAGVEVRPTVAVKLQPGETADYEVRLDRVGTGTYLGKVLIDSNDPLGPITVVVKGSAHEPPPEIVDAGVAEDTDGGEGRTLHVKPGCGCSQAEALGTGGLWAALALLSARRRRRAS